MSAYEPIIARLLALHPKRIDLSLERMWRVLERLGHPQRRAPPVIHVAGTNGKGSATAFSRALIEAVGLSAHVHTSPHLVRWHERYRLGVPGGSGVLVSDDALFEAVKRAEKANHDSKATIFEILTAVTFLLFAEQPADAAIIEVGLGGSFDATNVIEKPAVSLIMPVAFDHQSWLGSSIEEIATAKAGIIKGGCPVVVGRQDEPAALDVIMARARKTNSQISIYGQDYLGFEERGRFIYQDEDGLLDLPVPGLPGRHQFANAAAAIRAVKTAGFPVSQESASLAMKNVSWPARLQRLKTGNLVGSAPAGAEIWLDGGHNPHGGRAIAEAMAGFEERDPRPLFLITGMINTKDPKGYFEAFKGLARQVFTVAIRNSDAGLDPVALAYDAVDAGIPAEPAASVRDGLARISSLAKGFEKPPRILICGSLYFAGDVLDDNGTPPQ
jgi:dihydrofolate synthase/folylpolyglutamate synthase